MQIQMAVLLHHVKTEHAHQEQEIHILANVIKDTLEQIVKSVMMLSKTYEDIYEITLLKI